jgi:hypothetical protein
MARQETTVREALPNLTSTELAAVVTANTHFADARRHAIRVTFEQITPVPRRTEQRGFGSTLEALLDWCQ